MRAEVVRASRAKRVRPLAVAGMPASKFYQHMTDVYGNYIMNIRLAHHIIMGPGNIILTRGIKESAESAVVLLFFVLFLDLRWVKLLLLLCLYSV